MRVSTLNLFTPSSSKLLVIKHPSSVKNAVSWSVSRCKYAVAQSVLSDKWLLAHFSSIYQLQSVSINPWPETTGARTRFSLWFYSANPLGLSKALGLGHEREGGRTASWTHDCCSRLEPGMSRTWRPTYNQDVISHPTPTSITPSFGKQAPTTAWVLKVPPQ
jgi:hypothetical protein